MTAPESRQGRQVGVSGCQDALGPRSRLVTRSGPLSAHDMKRAMRLAADLGMEFQMVPGSPELARIFCKECGWPDDPRGSVIAQFIREPFGCCIHTASSHDATPGLRR